LWSCMWYINSVWHLGCRQVYCIGEVSLPSIGWIHIQFVLINRSISGSLLCDVFIINRLEEGFCVFRNGLISISDWIFGNVWSCSTLFIMKTSHKSNELISMHVRLPQSLISMSIQKLYTNRSSFAQLARLSPPGTSLSIIANVIKKR
jgi:hypothetical protein